MAEAKADAVLITALDETAWLFNMRGGDVDYNPIFVSYGLVTAKDTSLFVDAAKARAIPFAYLQRSLVQVPIQVAIPKLTFVVDDASTGNRSRRQRRST